MRTRLVLALGALATTASAQGHRAGPPPTVPSSADVARAQAAIAVALRGCLHGDAWSLRADLAFDPHTGRVTAQPPAGVTWSPQEQACAARSAARAHGPRFAESEFRTTLTFDAHDPRPIFLNTVDVAACVPGFDPCNCHVNVAVATSTRRPTQASSVTFDVNGCLVTQAQLACVEHAVGQLRFPVGARDGLTFRGVAGPRCTQ